MLRDRRPRAKITTGQARSGHAVTLYRGTDRVHEFWFWPPHTQEWHCDMHPNGNCQSQLTFMERKAIQEAE